MSPPNNKTSIGTFEESFQCLSLGIQVRFTKQKNMCAAVSFYDFHTLRPTWCFLCSEKFSLVVPRNKFFLLASRFFFLSENRGVKILGESKCHKIKNKKFQIKNFMCATDSQTNRPTLFRLECGVENTVLSATRGGSFTAYL